MNRGFRVGRTYNQNTLVTRAYQTSTILTAEPENAECRFIQQKKDELLVSLTKYFAKEMPKNELTSNLNTIKSELMTNCPSYTKRVGCC